ncbi:MAG: DUF4282 domain-containing protein [Alphaproteobacteria bacterium]|nr:DUF4282 domain-containing protein [Alphaproteobacteria bacterium]
MLKMFLTFDEFVFPKLVTIIYWIGAVVIVLSTLGGAFGAMSIGNYYGAGGIVGFLIALIAGVLSLIVWRVVMELTIVLFSIHDTLKAIRDQGK